MRSRAVIEQAEGILVERHELPADEAVRLPATTSTATDTKPRDLAGTRAGSGDLG
jgi:AmiR/NasT family two-component response regulator